MNEDEMFDVNSGLALPSWSVSTAIDGLILLIAPQALGFLAPLKLAAKWWNSIWYIRYVSDGRIDGKITI